MCLRCLGKMDTVYPRVGGGTPHIMSIKTRQIGLSPRGRGNLFTSRAILHRNGSIPAWAGEP